MFWKDSALCSGLRVNRWQSLEVLKVRRECQYQYQYGSYSCDRCFCKFVDFSN